jgi:hypothetical protein
MSDPTDSPTYVDDATNEVGIRMMTSVRGGIQLDTVAQGPNAEHLMLTLANSMGTMLDAHDAANYVEFTVVQGGITKYVTTVRRHDGKTPGELKAEVERERDAALEQLNTLRMMSRKLVTDRVAETPNPACELTSDRGFERCSYRAVAVRWEDGFVDNVCEKHADSAHDRGATVVYRSNQ